jgi:MscS family membrane protein
MREFNFIMSQTFLDNTLWQFATFALILFIGLTLKRFVSRLSNRLMFKLFRSYAQDVNPERFIALMHRPVSFTIMVIVFYIAFSQLNFPHYGGIYDLVDQFGIRYLIERGYFVVLYSAVIWIFLRIADFFSIVMSRRVRRNADR